MGPVVLWGNPLGITKHLFDLASSSMVRLGVSLLLGLCRVNYGQILTGEMKIAPVGRYTKCTGRLGRLRHGLSGLSLAFLNSDLLATSGATPGACIASV